MLLPDLVVVGGGQLARMMQQAAIGMGLRLRLLAEGPEVSAAQVIVDQQIGDYTKLEDLRRVVSGVPVLTFDHEHVPLDFLTALAAQGHDPRPGPDALRYAQDKAEMRVRLSVLGVPGPLFELLADDVEEALEELADFGYPAVLKTTRGGYDGKGVWVVHDPDEARPILDSGIEILAEELIDFRRELCAQVARSPSGQLQVYPVVQSTQVDGVCKEVIAPAPELAEATALQAQNIARQIAEQLDVTGMLAVELFETTDGRVLVNELAMRPHNTGHWSIDGARTSQFENHLRAVLDLPLGSGEPRQRWTVMVNILGGAVLDLDAQRELAWAEVPQARIHLYGKAEIGRAHV